MEAQFLQEHHLSLFANDVNRAGIGSAPLGK
jgi:hypothetical protein